MPEFRFCCAFYLDMDGKEKYTELWCRRYEDMYAHFRNMGQKLVKYICY